MNRTTLGIWAIVFSFLCMAAMGFARDESQTAVNFDPTPVPRRTNPSDPKPKRSPYKNPSDPTPTPSKNPPDPTPTPRS